MCHLIVKYHFPNPYLCLFSSKNIGSAFKQDTCSRRKIALDIETLMLMLHTNIVFHIHWQTVLSINLTKLGLSFKHTNKNCGKKANNVKT